MNLPLGYRYAATYAGIRKQEADDVALIVPDQVAQAAAVFTTNAVQAAPVRLARKHLKASKGRVSAILINAGNANCATQTGDRVARDTCKSVAKALKTKKDYVVPASTGVIGVEMNADLISGAVPKLISELSPDRFEQVAHAIMTTDTRVKVALDEVECRRGTVRLAGMTKGAGMIHPNMATTLAFVVMDAEISAHHLQRMLAEATAQSFNSLTVDGDMSTNDTLVLLANGAASVKPHGRDRGLVQAALNRVLLSLAKQIAADGEGARKLITVSAAGFRNGEEARQVARSIANSLLVKTAIAGSDANWGRILCAAGYSGVRFHSGDIDISLQQVTVCRKGLAAEYDEAELKTKLTDSDVQIGIVKTGPGQGRAEFFTCDLTEGYIQINGSYRS